MKSKATPVTRATCAALLLSLLPALSAESMETTSSDLRNAAVGQSSIDPRGRSASEVLGQEVYGSGNESLGKISDLVVDSQNGKIAYAVVSSGGVLGVNRSLRAVPIEALRVSGQRLSLDLDASRWSQAPVFTKEQLTSLSEDRRARDLGEFFGEKSASDKRSGSARHVLVSDIRGKDVLGADGEIGEIDDVIVQLDGRKVAALLDPNDGLAGDDQKFLVPLNKLSGFDGANLRANLGREDFSRAQPYDTTSAARTDIGATLVAWGHSAKDALERGANRVANAAENVGDRAERAGDRAEDRVRDNTTATTPPGGAAPVEAIRRAVQADAKAAGVQGTVNVVAESDRVVLRGTVPSEDVKERLEERAERVAQGWDIDNQLRVASNRY